MGVKDVKSFAASSFRNGWLNYVTKGQPKLREGDGGVKEQKDHAEKVHIDDLPGVVDHVVATCCSPIPGDEVIGLVAVDGLPIEIHRTICPKAQEMILFGARMVKIDWNSSRSLSYQTEIRVSGMDKIGLINEITRIISSEMNLNIKSFHIEALNGLTEGRISLFVKDTDSLNDVLAELNIVDGITRVTRAD